MSANTFMASFKRFLSTHSVRSATVVAQENIKAILISIHALRKECDVFLQDTLLQITIFLSTHSVRSATGITLYLLLSGLISIHALRKECDRGHVRYVYVFFEFLSTHSVRSATNSRQVFNL